jgi:uncharacterized protein YciI
LREARSWRSVFKQAKKLSASKVRCDHLQGDGLVELAIRPFRKIYGTPPRGPDSVGLRQVRGLDGTMRSMRMLLFLIGGLLFAQQQWPPPGMRCPQRTLVLFERGPNWEKAATVAPRHLAYILEQMKAGKVLSGGPLEGVQPAAAMLFAVSDWSQVQAILNDEPFTHEGVLKIASHDAWNACEAAR